MNRICPRCKTVYSYASKECPNGCNKKARKEANEIYDKTQRKNQDFYSSKEWKRLREACKNKYSGLCIWTLYKHKRIVKGKIAHHIVPLEVNEELGLKLYNLLYVSDEAHREIHTLIQMCHKDNFALLNESLLKEIQDYKTKWYDSDEGVGI